MLVNVILAFTGVCFGRQTPVNPNNLPRNARMMTGRVPIIMIPNKTRPHEKAGFRQFVSTGLNSFEYSYKKRPVSRRTSVFRWSEK